MGQGWCNGLSVVKLCSQEGTSYSPVQTLVLVYHFETCSVYKKNSGVSGIEYNVHTKAHAYAIYAKSTMHIQNMPTCIRLGSLRSTFPCGP